ncbi:DUF421 domain-containing protein [Clostridium sp. UBA4395]|uniref:DUF421 domain-containing protein n=1 Tax=Clostridium sp. UBA4395 TaxID=1946360 RepID=UPI00321772FE
MDLFNELLIVTGRITTILPLLLFVVLHMGKRSIGELPIFDFLVIIILASVVGADIADPAVPHIHTAVAIVLLGTFQRIVSKIIIKQRKLGHIITFEPTIIIQDGQFLVENLTKQRYSIDNVLQLLREKNIFDITSIHLAIIEANGKLSILKQSNKVPVTLEDLDLTNSHHTISYPVILDGKVYEDVLKKLNLNKLWLHEQLLNSNINNTKEVFFASVNDNKELHISLKSFMKDKSNFAPIYH